MEAYKWESIRIGSDWFCRCTTHEHVPMIKKTRKGKYAVRTASGKLSINNTFEDAEKIAIEVYKKYKKTNKKFVA